MNLSFYIQTHKGNGKRSLVVGPSSNERISLLTKEEIQALPAARFYAYKHKFDKYIKPEVEETAFDGLGISFIKAYDYLRHAIKEELNRRIEIGE